MNLKYIVQDELGNAGTTLDIAQGEIKTLKVFWFDKNGVPYAIPTITELWVKIFYGVMITPLSKKLSLTQVSLIHSDTLNGNIGFQFSLSGTDTAGMPITSSMDMSATVTASGVADVQNFPSMFNVLAPLVP